MTESEHPLQSKAWEEFRKAWGNEVARVNGWLLTLHKLPLGFKIAIFEKGLAPTAGILSALTDFAKKENMIMVRMEPNIEKNNSIIQLLIKSGAVPGKTIFTSSTFWIDLAPSEEELMKSFSSKTRYNIRLAQRNGVEVVEDNSDKAFEKYLDLTRETTQRQGFYAHSEKYHRLMWEYLGKRQEVNGKRIAHLLVAKYKNEIITTWVLFSYKDFLYYPYGASSDKYKNVMANNLMMWEAIKLGKKLGLKTFDLWGREPGKGFTKFKEGYNPKVVEFIGTWDLVVNPFLYWLYRIAENIRWSILRLVAKLGLSKHRF